ncbi:MAG: hypothetical protein L0Y71_12395 [Gemmataceae bacterium]|nr:hypothetical protein [Gemmataceae bacterium]
MDRQEVKKVVRATLALLAGIAKKTRTQADDLLVAMLQSDEDRLVDAVAALLAETGETPTPEQVARALATVGIRV